MTSARFLEKKFTVFSKTRFTFAATPTLSSDSRVLLTLIHLLAVSPTLSVNRTRTCTCTCTHARMHARPHARTHARTHTALLHNFLPHAFLNARQHPKQRHINVWTESISSSSQSHMRDVEPSVALLQRCGGAVSNTSEANKGRNVPYCPFSRLLSEKKKKTTGWLK